ncbi:hypothetical protein NDU88_007665 [Pleurodeles waltl]|uniref:Uncharacterized protein n=1 Tax=Pleurodeles waltl TaxID=8319 RepID=A0AAV7N6Z5_PLEWA|nr:hypothetical protein NDU88_007665 [Pleurodeles waltl]
MPGDPAGAGQKTERQKTRDSPQADKACKRGGVASLGDRGRRARNSRETAKQAAGTTRAATTCPRLPTMPEVHTDPRETPQRGEVPPTAERRAQPERQDRTSWRRSGAAGAAGKHSWRQRILQEITAVSRRIEGMDASITSLTLETKSMRSDIAGVQSRVTGLEQRMGLLETQINTSQEREQDFLYLRSKLTDMEDRSQRDNIRLLGNPENEEGSDMQAFLSSTLPKMTSLDFDPPLEFQRAHRVGPKCSDNSSRPRPIIACLLRHNQTSK